MSHLTNLTDLSDFTNKTKTIFDKYEARPEGVENLTLSQFATSYTRCTKTPENKGLILTKGPGTTYIASSKTLGFLYPSIALNDRAGEKGPPNTTR